jgi:hypothetical protein
MDGKRGGGKGSFETRFGHISNAGIEEPNRGVNEFEFIAGVSWFF